VRWGRKTRGLKETAQLPKEHIMRTTIIISLCLSLIACQEQSNNDNTNNEADSEFSYTIETVPENHQSNSFDRTPNSIDTYIKHKLEQTHVNSVLDSFQFDAECIYGGLIEGELTVASKNPSIVVDLFDDNDLHIYEIEPTIYAISNVQDPSPIHLFENDNVELPFHNQYNDFSNSSSLISQIGQDPILTHIISENIEIIFHKEYIDLEINFMKYPNGQGKIRGDWFICPQ
jgi:hypothetical protein